MVAMLRLRMTMVYRDDDDTALIKSLQAVRLGEDVDDNDDDDDDNDDDDDDDVIDNMRMILLIILLVYEVV